MTCVGSAGLGMNGKEVPNDRQTSGGQKNSKATSQCLTYADIWNDSALLDPWCWEGPWSTGEPGTRPANPGTQHPCLEKRIQALGRSGPRTRAELAGDAMPTETELFVHPSMLQLLVVA